MITQTAFVRTNGIVVLDTITHVGLYLTLVVNPCDTEFANTIGDAEALNEVGLLKLGVLVVLFFDSRKNLTYCLDVLRLVGEALLQILNNLCCIHNLFFLFWLLYLLNYYALIISDAKLHQKFELPNILSKK